MMGADEDNLGSHSVDDCDRLFLCYSVMRVVEGSKSQQAEQSIFERAAFSSDS